MRRFATMLVVLLLIAAPAMVFGSAQPETEAPEQEMGPTPGVTDTEVVLGTFQALSGPVAAIGVPVANGIRAYLNWVNANGGVAGRQIRLEVADDAFDPSRTTVEVRRLVEEDEVFALVAGLGTPGNLAVMDYLEEQGVPHVYQASGSGLLTNPPKQNIFAVQPNYTVEGEIMVRYLVEERGFENIAMVYRNLDDGNELRNAVVATLDEYGLELTNDIAIDPAAQDFSASLVQISNADPDVIIMGLFLPQSSNFIVQAKELGLEDQEYLLTYSNADATFIALAQGQAAGAESMAWVDVDFTDASLPIFEVYRETFPGELPNAFAVAGMIAAEVAVEGLRIAGEDLTRESYRRALESMDNFTGIAADGIGFSPYNPNDPASRIGLQQMYVLRLEDGTWVRASDWIGIQ